eukprot:6306466-Prymnesium_polylepis.1
MRYRSPSCNFALCNREARTVRERNAVYCNWRVALEVMMKRRGVGTHEDTIKDTNRVGVTYESRVAITNLCACAEECRDETRRKPRWTAK